MIKNKNHILYRDEVSLSQTHRLGKTVRFFYEQNKTTFIINN
jgi:hypothetical protein